MHSLPAHFLAFFGAALGSPWVAWHEACLVTKGHPLPLTLLAWAAKNDIPDPYHVRFLHAHPIPLPAPIPLRKWLDRRGFPCIHLAGLSLRKGIYLHPDLPNEDAVIRHELIHTRQYQEAGSIFEFLRQYLFQCLTEGYENCEMEREANGEFETFRKRSSRLQ